MIRDATALAEARKNWEGVEAMGVRLQVGAVASIGVLGGIFPFRLLDAAYNLPFMHAWSVLKDVLLQLAIEGHFPHKRRTLGYLVRVSQATLSWQDYTAIKAGVNRRNAVAHHGQWLDREECQQYIDAIKVELQGWHIL